jgi:hypothetical protein
MLQNISIEMVNDTSSLWDGYLLHNPVNNEKQCTAEVIPLINLNITSVFELLLLSHLERQHYHAAGIHNSFATLKQKLGSQEKPRMTMHMTLTSILLVGSYMWW